ncbi:hypothetical protein FACS1894162_6890 [Bacteroidia bacterium]|nr:hypothetical protein FACS1894162_6890 [Bacteroidia bacterium]
MNTLTAEMDVAIDEKIYTIDEAFDIVGKRLSRNYGVEIIID